MSAPAEDLNRLEDWRCPDCERWTRAIAVGERVAEIEELFSSWFPHGDGPTVSVEWPSKSKAVNA